MRVGPFRNGGEARRNIRKESGKFREGWKSTQTEVVIGITHAVEAGLREGFR